jgi:hypothetical protein
MRTQTATAFYYGRLLERSLGLMESEYARTPFVFAVSTKSKVT